MNMLMILTQDVSSLGWIGWEQTSESAIKAVDERPVTSRMRKTNKEPGRLAYRTNLSIKPMELTHGINRTWESLQNGWNL